MYWSAEARYFFSSPGHPISPVSKPSNPLSDIFFDLVWIRLPFNFFRNDFVPSPPPSSFSLHAFFWRQKRLLTSIYIFNFLSGTSYISHRCSHCYLNNSLWTFVVISFFISIKLFLWLILSEDGVRWRISTDRGTPVRISSTVFDCSNHEKGQSKQTYGLVKLGCHIQLTNAFSALPCVFVCTVCIMDLDWTFLKATRWLCLSLLASILRQLGHKLKWARLK